MDKRNWYTGQVVTEGNLDQAFDNTEDATRNPFADAGIVGITTGLGVTPGAGVKQVSLASGVAYDVFGRRIYLDSTQTLTLTADSASAPITNPSGANVKWVSIFIKFEILESEPAIDGGGTEILTRTSDSYLIVIKQAAEAPLISATRASADADEVRCADVKLELATSTFVSGDIDSDAADFAFTVTRGDATTFGARKLDEIFTAMYQDVEDLVAEGAVDLGLLETRVDDIETAIDINGDTSLMPAPGGVMGHDYPIRDTESSARSLEFSHALAFAEGLQYLRRAEKLHAAGIPSGATFNGETPGLTTNELRTQLPLFQPKGSTWNTPTNSIPCLLVKVPLSIAGIHLRLYSYRWGLILTYNCRILTPDATVYWGRDVIGGASYDYDSWAISTGCFIDFSATNNLTLYIQDYLQPDTWLYGQVGALGWQSTALAF